MNIPLKELRWQISVEVQASTETGLCWAASTAVTAAEIERSKGGNDGVLSETGSLEWVKGRKIDGGNVGGELVGRSEVWVIVEFFAGVLAVELVGGGLVKGRVVGRFVRE